MCNAPSMTSGAWGRTTITGVIIATLSAPVAVIAIGPPSAHGDRAGGRLLEESAASAVTLAPQAPPAPAVPPAVIRASTRRAANRTWFQLATLVGTSGAGAPATTIQVVGANGVTLRELIGFAYMNDRGSITRSQIIGAPDWADTQRFDVIVPIPAGSGAGLTYNADQIANGGAAIPILQRLLADHFQLRVRSGESVVPVLDLVVIPGAAKPDLKPSSAACVQADPAQRCSFVAGPGFMTVRGMTMGHLAMQLSWNFPAITVPVRDRTGVAGKFDYALSFVPAFLTAPNPTAPNVANPSAGIGLSLSQALEERLGLRLADATANLHVVIVDSVRPLNQ
jgi:uncharacterized protein (TIGR03435 family)